MRYLISTFVFIMLSTGQMKSAAAKEFILESPDKKLKATVTINGSLSYSLTYMGKVYLLPSAIGMSLADGKVWDGKSKLIRSSASQTDRMLKPLYGIRATLREHYKELILDFSGDYSVIFRAYNEGFAYRFRTSLKDSMVLKSEQSEFRFNGDYQCYFHPALSEADYRLNKLSEIQEPNYSSMPLLLKTPDDLNIMIHESDVRDYPCMSLSSAGTTENRLMGNHAAYPKRVEKGGHANFNLLVKEREDHIARTKGPRSFPWRLISFEKEDGKILSNQLVYLLATESVVKETAWIKPGKVAWDWWNALNLSGVGFKTGFNTETYKYFIDFAARNGIEYINLDEGWSDQFDLMKITDKLDMPELIRYAKEKKVGIILWCVWYTLDRQMIPALNQFEKWGINGLKVDFMDGPNAERVGSDYSRVTKTVKKGDEIKLEMAAGGGWSARFSLTNK